MKESDVRVGNWINRVSNELISGVPESRIGKPIRVNANHIQSLAMAPRWNTVSYNPIPITEEILLKAGFVAKENKWYHKEYSTHLETCIICYNTISERCGIASIEEREDNEGIPVFTNGTRFVHQLQNLYFALTGEELNIEL